jgi:Phytanoyl-CoA dioxygenase (PhyH)
MPDTAAAEAGTAPAAVALLAEIWLRHNGHGAPPPLSAADWILNKLCLDALGLGLEQVISRVRDFSSAEDFLAWAQATAGGYDAGRLARFDAVAAGAPPPPETRVWLDALEAAAPVLSEGDLSHWRDKGYVILRDAVSPEEAAAAAAAVHAYLGADPDDPDTWYPPRRHGIMVQLFQHAALEPARRSPRIHKAFAQLWGTADLWMTTDRVSFNPPERPGYTFPGPALHWDASLATPIAFQTQAILYLSDTPPDQGAFQLVEGFHNRIEAWLKTLPAGVDPRRVELSAQARPVGASAGDLIIWNAALPHGASPNRGARPRIAQYVNMYPATLMRAAHWR